MPDLADRELDVVHVEVHDHLVTGDPDVVHPTDPDPGHLHDVALAQAAGVGELGVVAGPPEARELLEVERGGHGDEQHDEADRAEAQDGSFGAAGHHLHLSAVE